MMNNLLELIRNKQLIIMMNNLLEVTKNKQ